MAVRSRRVVRRSSTTYTSWCVDSFSFHRVVITTPFTRSRSRPGPNKAWSGLGTVTPPLNNLYIDAGITVSTRKRIECPLTEILPVKLSSLPREFTVQRNPPSKCLFCTVSVLSYGIFFRFLLGFYAKETACIIRHVLLWSIIFHLLVYLPSRVFEHLMSKHIYTDGLILTNNFIRLRHVLQTPDLSGAYIITLNSHSPDVWGAYIITIRLRHCSAYIRMFFSSSFFSFSAFVLMFGSLSQLTN